MAKIQDIDLPYLEFAEGAAPSTPASAVSRIYVKADGLFYSKDDAGVETLMSSGAAGGNYTGVLWSSGTSMPGSPSTNQRVTRTDLGLDFFYDGTRWLSVLVFQTMLWPGIGTPAGNLRTQISATTSGTGRAHVPAILGASDIWLVGHKSAVFINSGGTALSASHKWVGTLVGLDAAGSSTGTVSTISYDSGSSNVFREQYNAIAAVKAAGTIAYQMDWTKTGTPGNFAQGDVLYTRIIAT